MTTTRKKPGRAPSATNLNALTQELLAEMHGVTGRTIVNWDKDGHPRNDDGSYTAADSIRWRLDREIHQGLSLEAERAKLAKAQQEKANLDLAVRRGELLERSVVIRLITALLIAMRARLRALPSRLSHELMNLTGYAETRTTLAAGIDECLMEISDAAFVNTLSLGTVSVVDRDRQERGAATETDGEPVGGQASDPVARGKQRVRSVEHGASGVSA